MGFIRSGLLVIVSVILFMGFLLMNSLLVVSNSLEYKNIQEELIPVVTEFLSEQINLESVSENQLILMQEYCINQTEFVFSEAGETFAISCDAIEGGVNAIVEEMISGKVEEIYYADYSCDFIDCFEEQRDMPYFLVSEQTKNYFENKFYFLMLVCLFISIGIFFLVRNKTNAPILVGGLLLIASLVFVKLDSVAGFFADKSLLKFFGFLFTSSYSIAIKGIFAGIILIIIGIISKSFKVGFWISGILSKILIIIGIISKFFKVGFWISRILSKFRKDKSNNSSNLKLVKKDTENSKKDVRDSEKK